MALFLAVMGAAAVAIPWLAARARKQGGEQVERALESLATRGWVVEEAKNQNGRPVVRVWGLLAHPVSLDLRVARRSRWWAGARGAARSALDPAFERRYRVVSREPDRARLILEPAIQQRLMELGNAELRLGSFDSLLPRAYSADSESSALRRLRRLWMIRLPGKLANAPPEAELAETGRLLAAAVAGHCMSPSTPDRREFETRTAEGQWV